MIKYLILSSIVSLSLSCFANPKVFYICTGNFATHYHAKSDCIGFNNCNGNIIAVDSITAVKKKKCNICFKSNIPIKKSGKGKKAKSHKRKNPIVNYKHLKNISKKSRNQLDETP